MVLDADCADAAGLRRGAARGRIRVLTPHPGEMARLTGRSTAEVQKDRVGAARAYRHRTRRHPRPQRPAHR